MIQSNGLNNISKIGLADNYLTMGTRKFLIAVVFLSSWCLNGLTQDRKNAVVLELGGKSFYYFDISYERYLTPRFHLGAGVGLGGIYTMYNSVGNFKNYEIRLPVYGGYALGKKKHHAITEFGVMIEDDYHTNGYSSFHLWPFISGGYEFKGDKIIIRVPVYLGYVGKNLWYPPILPWAGVSIGVPF